MTSIRWQTLRSRWALLRLSGTFWLFVAVSHLFTFGIYVFVLLYNLYLLDRGFKEDFLGFITSAWTLGNVAGTLVAVGVSRRLGLKRTLLACFAGMAVVSAMRALVVGKAALLGSAFLGGITFALWVISLPVTLSQLTSVELRTVGFSAYLASGIGMGMFADAVGGWLPGWLGPVIGTTTPVKTKQAALLVGCAISAVAIWPALHLPLAPIDRLAKTSYPRGPFILRFLFALALLNLGTGAFNPFANAYFAQYLKMPVHEIGLVFSAGQLAQVGAILLAPVIVRRLGQVRGIMVIEIFTGLSLAFLAAGPVGLVAAMGYAGYLAFQWMDEPVMESLLMTQVAPAQRSGAAALMYMVIFCANAMAAPLAGTALTGYGYPLVMATAAACLVLGGLAFGLLLRRYEPGSR
ncbi:MAG TPA: MFS transporter [Methylomirabilota bacterium]|nr:MFS transporter [Methylomirabilota bacterium]